MSNKINQRKIKLLSNLLFKRKTCAELGEDFSSLITSWTINKTENQQIDNISLKILFHSL